MTLTIGQAAVSFLSPALFAAGAAAVAIPILIHLLSKARRRPLPWGAMRFLLEAFRRHRRRMRFEQWLLLAVRCAAVLALALAVGGVVLAGWLGDWAGALGARDRHVHVVLDRGLTTRALEAGGETRFDRLRAQAIELIDTLEPTDVVTLWSVRTQGEAPPEAMPPSEARAVLRDMQPGFGPSRRTTLLERVAAELEETPDTQRQPIVVVLSDWSAGGSDEAAPWGASGDTLSQRAAVRLSRPGLGTSNRRLIAARPLRPVVNLGSDREPVVPIEVSARRFGGLSAEAKSSVRVELLDTNGQRLGDTLAELQWKPDESLAYANVYAALDAPEGGSLDDGALIVRASLAGAGSDANALVEDDVTFALAQLRRQLRVGVLASDVAQTGDAFTARRWFEMALSPWSDAAYASVELLSLSRSEITADQLSKLDALVVTRPDSLGRDAVSAVGAFVRDGGLLWVTAPPVASPAEWFPPLDTALGLGWQFGAEPVAPNMSDHTAGWRLDTDASPPNSLNWLSAEWPALLGPVRVDQRFTVEAARSDRWIDLALSDGPAAWLVSKPVVRGRVVLLASPLDPAWTNLQAKPVFVPLVHETILAGAIDAARDRLPTIAVDQPAPATGPWEKAAALSSLVAVAPPASERFNVTSSQPLVVPGVYQAKDQAGLLAAVNLTPDQGDTSVLPIEALQRAMPVGDAWALLDPADPAGALRMPDRSVVLAWTMLWVLLGLIVLETALARWFSHARAGAGAAAVPTSNARRHATRSIEPTTHAEAEQAA